MMLLEEVFKIKKVNNTDQFNLRIQRGLSWFKKSIELEDDFYFKFISLWASYHALSAQENVELENKTSLSDFLSVLYRYDQEQKIAQILWTKFHKTVQYLLENIYLLPCFWKYQNQIMSREQYQEAVINERLKVQQAYIQRDSKSILHFLFERLFTLRHQLLYGGTIYNSMVNRQQVKESCGVFSALLSSFILILLENSQILDDLKPFYPQVQIC